MFKLKRLKIHQYRNVRPGCELLFNERRNILLGPNGSGKTTLLRFISSTLRSYLEGDEPFSIEYECSFNSGEGSLTAKISNLRNSQASSELQMPNIQTSANRGPLLPEFDLNLRLENPSAELRIWRKDDKVVMQISGDTAEQTIAPIGDYYTPPYVNFVPVSVWMAASKIGRKMNILGSTANAFRFDESLDMFRSITSRDTDIGIPESQLRPIFIVPSNVQPPLLKNSFGTGLWPPSLIRAVLARVSPELHNDLAIPHDQLEFLAKTVKLLGLQAADAKIEILQKSIPGDRPSMFTFSNLRFFFTRHDGSQFADHLLSYGQKRLLTFLYYLAANPDLILADELVNGMHHGWIDYCLEEMGDRQAFLTSQNPLLLDHLYFESVEQVRSTFIVSRVEILEGREQLVWRNLTEDESDMFYRAYQVGIEHVGEILRTRGLW